MENVLYEAGEFVLAAQKCLQQGEYGLSTLPGLIKKIIDRKMWCERLVLPTQEVKGFKTFAEFVAADLPDGLHTDVRTLKHICRDDKEARAAIDKAIDETRRQGERNDLVDNIHEVSRPTGTSSDAALRRLRKDREDLFRQVLDGDLSPHAAAVKAGFRQKTITVPIDAQKAAVTITKHFPREARLELVRLLSEVD